MKVTKHFMAQENFEMVEQIPEPDSSSADVSFIENFDLNAENESAEHRHNVVRAILDRIPSLSDHDLEKVAAFFDKLPDGFEPDVRIDLLDKLPELAKLYSVQDEPEKIETNVVPILLNALKDCNENVRKKSVELFLILIEYRALSLVFTNSYVVPGLATIATQGDSEEIRLDAITILGRLINYLEAGHVKNHLYDIIIGLSKSPSSQIKRAAILLFGPLCRFIGPEAQNHMVPIVVKAMQTDKQHYLVKTAIIEFISQMAKTCTKETRREILTPLFLTLIQDPYHRVRNVAYHHLGSFIHSFSESNKNGIVEYNGELNYFERISHNKDDEEEEEEEEDDDDSKLEDLILDYCNNNDIHRATGIVQESVPDNVPTPDMFNNFQFWKEPLPDIKVDQLEESSISYKNFTITNSSDRMLNGEETTDNEFIGDYSKTDSKYTPNVEGEEKLLSRFIPSTGCSDGYSPPPSSSRASTPDQDIDVGSQDIVPPELLNLYIHMLDSKVLMYNNDGDLPYHCAYSFPAVTMTLGQNHWSLLRDAYMTLTQYANLKIRTLIAYSFHDMVQIVGFAHATRDLIPIFLKLLGDEDEEVRSGLVNHLSTILQSLKDPEAAAKDIEHIKKQQPRVNGFRPFLNREPLSLLPELFKLLNSDNNWRLRLQLAFELITLLSFYGPYEAMHFIFPLIVSLLRDKVTEVRNGSVKLVCQLYCQIIRECELRQELLHFLISNLALSDQWRERQLFVYLCENLILSEFLFAQDHKLLAHNMLLLHADSVVSVRLVLARCIANEEIQIRLADNKDQFSNTLERLKNDKSLDVRLFLTSS